MKKRYIAFILVVIMIFCSMCTLNVYAINKTDDIITIEKLALNENKNVNRDKEIITPYNYPATPGTDVWDSLDIDTKISISSISENTAGNMTTSALLITTLQYPFIINIYAYDTIEEGINIVKGYFSPLSELVERTDAIDVISAYISFCQAQENTDSMEFYIASRLRQYISSQTGVRPHIAMDPITGEPHDQVRTPKGSLVPVYYNLSWSNFNTTYDECYQYSVRAQSTYGATIISNPSPKYNCHSYAWHHASTSNKFWMNSPGRYIIDGSYVSGSKATGNKVTYKNSSGKYTHSGIVHSSGKITSKWGPSALMRHDVYSCPYYVAGATVNYWKSNT